MNLKNIKDVLEEMAQTRDDKTIEFKVDVLTIKRAWTNFWKKRRRRKWEKRYKR